MAPEIHPQRFPRIEMIRRIYRSARAVGGADRPVLLKSCRTLDRGLIGAGGFEDVVGAAITSDGSLFRGACGGVVSSEVFDNIVFN